MPGDATRNLKLEVEPVHNLQRSLAMRQIDLLLVKEALALVPDWLSF
jgi:hypothetical protein